MRLFHRICAVLLFFALPLAVFGGGKIGFLSVEKLLEEAAEVTLLTYPNADDVMLDDRIETVYTADGKSVTWDDTAIKILTEKGRRNNRVIVFSFNKSYSREEVKLVQTIAPDGTVTDHDPAAVCRVVTDTSQMASNIYDPNDKKLQVNIPGLQVNHIVRYVVRRETFKPRVPNTFSDYHVFEYSSPIRRYTFQLDAPAELPLSNTALLSELEGTVKYRKKPLQGGGIRHLWTAEDVPMVFPEPKSPPMYTCVQRLLVSTIQSWEDVSRWYWNLCLPHLTVTPEIEAKVAELVSGKKTDMEKIRSVFRFVSQEIRYMGETTETEAPGYEPHDAAQTFGKRHGVCRDKAALLAAMLRTAGFQAYPVLIHAGARKDPEVPQPYFNHAITGVYLDGKYVLMDSTDENTAELFPAYLSNRSYLVARPEGEKLLVSPVPPADDNLLSVKTLCSVDAAGDLTGYCTMTFNGINDNAYRGTLLSMDESRQKLFIETVVKRVLAGGTLSKLDIYPENLMDTDVPLRLEAVFKAKSVMGGNEETAFMRYPLFSRRFGMVNFIIGDCSLDKRRFPMVTRFPCAVEEELKLTVDPSWGRPEEIPECKPVDTETMEWKRTAAWEDGTLVLNTRTAFKTVQFSPEEYGELKRNLEIMDADAQKMAVFSRKEPLPASKPGEDVIVLEDNNRYLLKSAKEWSSVRYVKLKVMTYNGKKDCSELKISYFPDFETGVLDFARVYNGAECKELNLSENKIMDAGWVASAPRYPGEQILVANLPGVEVGSVIEYQYTVSSSGCRPFSMISSFRGDNPVESKVLSIETPRELELSTGVFRNGMFGGKDGENIREEIEERGDAIIRTWTGKNLPALPPEGNMPYLRFVVPTVWASVGSWKDYAEEVGRALNANVLPGERITKMAEDMDAMSDGRVVKAVRNMVARNIRTAGPSFTNVPLSALSHCETTLGDGYGNKADKAVLLYSILETAGLQPEFILVRPALNSKETEKRILEYFDPGLFSVVLVRVKADGMTVWLNDSDEYAEPGTCAYEGHQAMTLDGKIFTITVPEKYRTRKETRLSVRIYQDGAATVDQTVEFYGDAHGRLNKLFAEQTPEERRRYLLSLVNAISVSARASGDFITDFDSYPGRISFSAEVPDFASLQGDLMYMGISNPLPGLLSVKGNGREFPYESKLCARGRMEVKYYLPAGYNKTAFMPETTRFKLPVKKPLLSMKCKKSGNIVNFSYEYDIAPFYFEAKSYPDFIEVLRRIEHTSSNVLMISKENN